MAINKLKFRSVNDDFKLIEQKNLTCFMPLVVPIQIDGINESDIENIFSISELNFLMENGIYPNDDNGISGEKVFDLYLNSIHNKTEFTKQQIRKKVLLSIMSKYTFSIFASARVVNELIHFYNKAKSEYGYIYIQRWNEIYSIKQGLDANKLIGIEESQYL
jgi:CRISPR-associated endonuclease/helicase Cas3